MPLKIDQVGTSDEDGDDGQGSSTKDRDDTHGKPTWDGAKIAKFKELARMKFDRFTKLFPDVVDHVAVTSLIRETGLGDLSSLPKRMWQSCTRLPKLARQVLARTSAQYPSERNIVCD